MPSTLSNSFLDTLGIVKAAFFKAFSSYPWSAPQPMLNILQVKEGKEDLFKEFLSKSLQKSIKYNTPISFGPYEFKENRTFVYITGYPSTPAFLKVDFTLALTGLAFLRARATQKAIWSYCDYSFSDELPEKPGGIFWGIQGDPSRVLARISEEGISVMASIDPIKDVREKSQGKYLLLPSGDHVDQLLQVLIDEGEDIMTYKLSRFS